MKFRIQLSGKTLHTAMRQYGYAAEKFNETTGEFAFYRMISGRPYPKFHIYCTTDNDTAFINLHLDQKQPTYAGSSAHSGEYDGPLIESEAARIQRTVQ